MMRIVLAIPTSGRPGILRQTLSCIADQTLPPDRVIVAISDPADIDPEGLPVAVEVILAPRGCSRQRNAIIDRVDRDDLVIFLDDDFLIAPDYCAQAHALFDENPSVVMATGHVIADGIGGPGFPFDEAARLLPQPRPASDRQIKPVYNCYGCNMVLRAQPALEHGIRFDEKLPLYGWLEDVDFSRLMAQYGQIVACNTLQGVHMGTKTGRTPGVKLGYSQIANPFYLLSKGTISAPRALRIMARNLAMNLLRAPRPEAWIDRRGRLRGNLLALKDLFVGRLRPEQAEFV